MYITRGWSWALVSISVSVTVASLTWFSKIVFPGSLRHTTCSPQPLDTVSSNRPISSFFASSLWALSLHASSLPQSMSWAKVEALWQQPFSTPSGSRSL